MLWSLRPIPSKPNMTWTPSSESMTNSDEARWTSTIHAAWIAQMVYLNLWAWLHTHDVWSQCNHERHNDHIASSVGPISSVCQLEKILAGQWQWYATYGSELLAFLNTLEMPDMVKKKRKALLNPKKRKEQDQLDRDNGGRGKHCNHGMITTVPILYHIYMDALAENITS